MPSRSRFSLPRLRSSSAKRPASGSGRPSRPASLGVDVRTAAPGRRSRAQAKPSPADGGASGPDATTSTPDVKYAMATPSPPTRPGPPRREASAGSASSGPSDGEFMSAFDRSPPSFDEVVVSESGGVFPRARAAGGRDGGFPPSEFGNVVSPEGNAGSRDASDGWGVPPTPNGWGDGASATDRSGEDGPAGGGDVWFEPFGDFGDDGAASPPGQPSAKTRRLVSPEPSPSKGQGGAPGSAWGGPDDGAWGDVVGRSLYSGAKSPEKEEEGSKQDGFADGFFGTFGDDGFGAAAADESFQAADESFFGSSWGDANTSSESRSSDPWGDFGAAQDGAPGSGPADPWAGEAFGTDPFGAGDSSERPAGVEADAKEDAGAQPRAVPPTPAPSQGEVRQPSEETAGEVWGQPGGASAHPLQQRDPPTEAQGEKSAEQAAVSSDGPSRLESPAAPESKGHRRDPSSGSQSSNHRGGVSRAANGIALAVPSAAPARRNKGGSVGSNRSNSSAVDSILEHYRQKRRQKQAAAIAAAGGGDVASTPGSNGSSAGERTGAGHLGGPAGHRRAPSSESVDRAVATLQAAASSVSAGSSLRSAASAAGGGYRSTPSPTMRYQMPAADGGATEADRFLFANIRATLGSQGVAPDLESLSGRSSRSNRSGHGPPPGAIGLPPGAVARASRSRHGPRRSPGRKSRGGSSVASSHSHRSFRTYASNRSQLTNMSKESQSVANDLFRLEAQLAEQVARQERNEAELLDGPSSEGKEILRTSSTRSGSQTFEEADGLSVLGAEAIPRIGPVRVVAPPGKLGILLANRAGRRGPSHVSAVRGGSVLAGKVRVGDMLLDVDGTDVTGMSSREITGIVGRRRDEERVLTFLPVEEGRAPDEWV